MAEFWEEQSVEDQRDLRKQAVRWAILFVLLIAFLGFATWWASSAVHFSSSRVDRTTSASYRVTGIVRDAATGAPVPWAEIADDPGGHPPLFHASADRLGAFELVTIAEPHIIVITAPAYHPANVRVGRAWYIWMPKGTEQIAIRLLHE